MTPQPSEKILAKAQQWRTLVAQQGDTWTFDEARTHYQSIYADEPVPIAWLPDETNVAQSNMVQTHQALGISSYADFYDWSIDHKAQFWETALRRLGIKFEEPYAQILDDSLGPEEVRWLPGARLNIVESCFQAPADRLALVVSDEQQRERRWTYGELDTLTQRVAAGLVRVGLVPGDRILLYMPLSAEAVAAYLGIVRAGMVAVLVADSFSATELERRITLSEAKLVITVEAYHYNDKPLAVYERACEAG